MRKKRTPLGFKYSDGGRKRAGFVGTTLDCAVRATTMALNVNYGAMYEAFCYVLGSVRRQNMQVINGVPVYVLKHTMKHCGWRWHSCKSKKLRFCREDLPRGKVVAIISCHEGRWGYGKECHVVFVDDKVAHDHGNAHVEEMWPLLGYFTRDRDSLR